jgi:large subunit ribosomal protein L7/L12
MVEKKKALKEEEKEVVSNETEKIDLKKESAVSEELSDEILKKIEKMTVLELADLVKALEKKFGVTAAMPVGMPSNAAGAVAAGEDNKVEEKTDFKVILKEIGPNKIKVIKEIRTFTALGLKESKDLVEGAPNIVKENVDKKEAEGIKEKLEAVGAVVEIK